MQSLGIIDIVFVIIPMILALTVHEYAHAWVAYRLGDDTAARQGRMTLNPISHIDPIGTLVIPIVGLSSGIPFFGWAKPVPISPVHFSRSVSMQKGMLLTAAAGPISNLLFATLMAVVLRIFISSGSTNEAVLQLIKMTLQINVGLFLFNLLPVPPLDGSKVLAGLLPNKHLHILEFLSHYSFILFIAILFFGGSLIGPPFNWIVSMLLRLVGL